MNLEHVSERGVDRMRGGNGPNNNMDTQSYDGLAAHGTPLGGQPFP